MEGKLRPERNKLSMYCTIFKNWKKFDDTRQKAYDGMGSSGQDSVWAGKLWGVLNLSLRASGLVHFWLRRHAEHPYDDENDNVRLHGGKVLDWSPVVY